MINFNNDFPKVPFLETLGIHLLEVGSRHAVMGVKIEERHRNYLGGAHGGLLAALADTVCFFPQPLIPSGRKMATVNLNISYVRSAAVGDTLTARSELLHLGRRTASLVIRITNQNQQLLAHGSVTLMQLDSVS